MLRKTSWEARIRKLLYSIHQADGKHFASHSIKIYAVLQAEKGLSANQWRLVTSKQNTEIKFHLGYCSWHASRSTLQEDQEIKLNGPVLQNRRTYFLTVGKACQAIFWHLRRNGEDLLTWGSTADAVNQKPDHGFVCTVTIKSSRLTVIHEWAGLA